MRGKALISSLALAVLAGALSSTATAQTAPAAPTVVGTDDEGDWNNPDTSDAPLGGVGDALGQDLIEAAIQLADEQTVNFIFKVTSLPPIGGTPEASRYVWGMTVDGNYVEIDGKYSNYSRGACDPTAGSCPPPRDPGSAPFAVRGDCTTDPNTNVTTCVEKALVHGTFDAAEGTITVPVSFELLGAKPGSIIGPGASDFGTGVGGEVYSVPSAFFSSSGAPYDALVVTDTFTIPGGEEAKPKKKKKKKKKKGGATPTEPTAPTSLKPFVF